MRASSSAVIKRLRDNRSWRNKFILICWVDLTSGGSRVTQPARLFVSFFLSTDHQVALGVGLAQLRSSALASGGSTLNNISLYMSQNIEKNRPLMVWL